MDKRGRFNETLITNVQGMLALYEVAHLRVHGEDILEEALAFTTTHLKAIHFIFKSVTLLTLYF